jgi:hypothetical protein
MRREWVNVGRAIRPLAIVVEAAKAVAPLLSADFQAAAGRFGKESDAFEFAWSRAGFRECQDVLDYLVFASAF